MGEVNLEAAPPRRLTLKSIATEIGLFMLGGSTGGFLQFITEQPTSFVRGVVVDKTALNANVTEEFLEGSIPVVASMMTGKLLYRFLCAKIHRGPFDEYDRETEVFVMCSFGFLGYLSTVALGGVLHDITGQADIKWGPFK